MVPLANTSLCISGVFTFNNCFVNNFVLKIYDRIIFVLIANVSCIFYTDVSVYYCIELRLVQSK